MLVRDQIRHKFHQGANFEKKRLHSGGWYYWSDLNTRIGSDNPWHYNGISFRSVLYIFWQFLFVIRIVWSNLSPPGPSTSSFGDVFILYSGFDSFPLLLNRAHPHQNIWRLLRYRMIKKSNFHQFFHISFLISQPWPIAFGPMPGFLRPFSRSHGIRKGMDS